MNGSGGEDIIFELAEGPVFAQGGNDLIISQAPAASPFQAFLDGGAGTDTVRIFSDIEDHTVRFARGVWRGDIATIRGADGTRTLRNVELVQFDEGATEQENDALEVAWGTASPDIFVGFEGEDAIAPEDWPGNVVPRGAENDFLVGTRADDTLRGDNADNEILGHFGNDLLQGCAGNDHFLGGAGNDTLLGGAGAAS